MKNLNLILLLNFFLFLSMGCKNESKLPFVTFDEMEYGAYPRLIDGINGMYGTAFNLQDVPGSSIGFTVEFVDENEGRNISDYSWTVEYSDGTIAPINGFVPNSWRPEDLLYFDYHFSFQQVLSVLGKSVNDVKAGEHFVFEATLTRDDGTIFTSENTSAAIQNIEGTFRGMFKIIVPIF